MSTSFKLMCWWEWPRTRRASQSKSSSERSRVIWLLIGPYRFLLGLDAIFQYPAFMVLVNSSPGDLLYNIEKKMILNFGSGFSFMCGEWNTSSSCVYSPTSSIRWIRCLKLSYVQCLVFLIDFIRCRALISDAKIATGCAH